ncbi:MAG TPA: DUF5916 domain-containing protein, partial [Longimicrobiaceae bacterium]|nr:DUF5916 domain-containing protein [Longimicrobiaceae bacterium]
MKRIAPLLLLLVQLPLEAQEPQASRAPAPRRVLGAAPLPGDVRTDGRVDDPARSAAEVAAGFTQAYPRPGAPASEGTEIRVLAGPDALYVAARMLDSRPDSIVAPLARRDAAGIYTDQVQVSIDSRNDRRTAFLFSVNPRGVKRDVFLYDDTREDASWDAVWDVATAVDSSGWTAEFRIPYSQLRFSGGPADGRVWGLGVMRDLARKEERSTWSPWTRNSPGFVSSHGELAGLAGIRAPGRLEVLPYTSARLERAPGDRANPFYDANDWASSVGADVQYGVPGGLTLTATVNPDFGLGEVDPADVNLTAFETFFTERRPFFVEGSDIFRFGQLAAGNTYGFSEFFYSRRIGRPPQRVLGGPDVLQVDAPEQSTILAAAKLSGKTAGGWSVGLMDAVTSREEARYLTASGERSAPVEPLSNYLVGRLRRDLDRGNTVLGGIATATHRDLGGSEFDALLRSRAMLAGVDAQHSWKARAWTASGYLAGTRVEGSRQVITGAQTSSARYYQRPDADYLRLDSTRTALDGYTGAAAIRHSGSWDASLAYQAVSPGFEVNDLGFQGRTDSHAVSTFLGHRINRPGRVFRDKLLALYAQHAWNFGGD